MTSPILRTVVISLLACGGAGALLFKLQASPPRPPVAAHDESRTSLSRSRTIAPHEPRPPDDGLTELLRPYATAFNARRAAAPKPAASVADQPSELDPDDTFVPLPLAAALAYVGADEFAEALWEVAINDPTLSAEDRKDLIEDLNEDGFPDPKNITQADLPLIEARLALIERLAPDALDDTNAAAFEEARKDLQAMRARLVPPTPAAPPPQPAP